MTNNMPRRDFLKTSTLAAAGATMPYWYTSESARANIYRSALERPVIGCVGTGDRWRSVINSGMQHCDVAAVCDVDESHVQAGKKLVAGKQNSKGGNKAIDVYEDYQKVLERKDLDIITCVTPDHWHTKVCIDAMKSGKDVYCEKPLTLTIMEGIQLCKVLTDTKRVLQVGTQQRTEMGKRFLYALALIRNGRIGKIKEVTCAIGGAPTCGELPVIDVPKGLNWDMWLGQAPKVPLHQGEKKAKQRRPNSRCHYEFRWWYEYSGGKLTDWGAHHVDIAMWGLDRNGPGQGPKTIEVLHADHPVPFNSDGFPTVDNMYNTATKFHVKCTFPDGVVLNMRDSAKDLGFGNGIQFVGDKGTLFVSRSELKGDCVDELKENPLPSGSLEKVYGGPIPKSHFLNFVESMRERKQPISDAYTHHRALTVCHLAGIAMRLNRTVTWDSEKETIIGDEKAKGFISREQRKGFEIEV